MCCTVTILELAGMYLPSPKLFGTDPDPSIYTESHCSDSDLDPDTAQDLIRMAEVA
jgi:hypothetical protein